MFSGSHAHSETRSRFDFELWPYSFADTSGKEFQGKIRVNGWLSDQVATGISYAVFWTHYDGSRGNLDSTEHIGNRCRGLSSYVGNKMRQVLPTSQYGLIGCDDLHEAQVNRPISNIASHFRDHYLLVMKAESFVAVDVSSKKYVLDRNGHIDADVFSAPTLERLKNTLGQYYGGVRWNSSLA